MKSGKYRICLDIQVNEDATFSISSESNDGLTEKEITRFLFWYIWKLKSNKSTKTDIPFDNNDPYYS